jgi:hypothetical protein
MLLSKIKEYFSQKPVDKEYYLEYYIKKDGYIERIVYKTEEVDYNELKFLGFDSVTRGFYQDGVIYSPNIIIKVFIKEKQ